MFKAIQRSASTGVTAASMHKLYKTINDEVEQPLQGDVKGTVPSWVNGSLYRNGPGMYEVGEHKFKHWFDGMAILQRFHITNGNVTYQRKYIRSDAFKNNTASKRITVNEFATASVPDPCKNIFRRFLTKFETPAMTDNTDVNIFPLKDDLYAATETMFLNKIDPETLDKVEKVNLEEQVGVNLTTAHPHWDSDGNMYNIGHVFGRDMSTVLVAVPPKKDGEESFPKGEIVYRLRTQWTSFNYYHSFHMTENYFVFVQQPLLSNVPKILMGRFTGSAYAQSLTYYPEIKNRFRIVDRKTGKEVNGDCTFETDSFFYFHQINAYEDQGHVIIDISCHKNHDILDRLYMKHLSSEKSEESFRSISEGEARRYVIPLDVNGKKNSEDGDTVTLEHTTAKCTKLGDDKFHLEAEILADIGLELPQINYQKYNAKKYRYIYGVGQRNKEHPLFRVVKIDADTKTFTEWKEERCYPSEPVFIPRPGGETEDDGVLVAAINRSGEGSDDNSCFLLVLDGKTFREMARVEFEGVERFPRDFHGVYTSDKKMEDEGFNPNLKSL